MADAQQDKIKPPGSFDLLFVMDTEVKNAVFLHKSVLRMDISGLNVHMV